MRIAILCLSAALMGVGCGGQSSGAVEDDTAPGDDELLSLVAPEEESAHGSELAAEPVADVETDVPMEPGASSETRGDVAARAATSDPGWTSLAPTDDARIVYVSSSEGSDDNDGSSPDSPKQSIAAGYALLRHGSSDQLLLKRGDRFAMADGATMALTWRKSGASAEAPIVLGAYGEGPRPIVDSDTGSGLMLTSPEEGGTLQHVAVAGVHFYASGRDPDTSGYAPGRTVIGISIVGTPVAGVPLAEDVLIEDCMVQSYGFGISAQGEGHDAAIRDVRIRRSIIVDSYSTESNVSAVFASHVDGLRIEENVIDWTQREDVPGRVDGTMNHSIYIQVSNRDVVVRGNIIARAQDGCMQRAGGSFEDNLVMDVTVGHLQGYVWSATNKDPVAGGVEAAVVGNAFVGDDVAMLLGNLRKGLVADNLMVSERESGTGIELLADTDGGNIGVHDLLVEQNQAIGVQGLRVRDGVLRGIEVHANRFQAGTQQILRHVAAVTSAFRYEDNTYFGLGDRAAWFEVDGSPLDLEAWLEISGEDGTSAADAIEPSPVPSVAAYHAERLGGEASVAAFLAEARKQSRARWDVGYTAVEVIRYLRDVAGR